MHNRLIEESANFVRLFCLPKNPHQFRDDSFCSHAVCLNQIIALLHVIADLIDCHITSFMGNLGGHDNSLSSGEKIMNGFFKTGISIGRKTAYAKAFNDNCIVMLSDILQNVRTDTWNQSKYKNICYGRK